MSLGTLGRRRRVLELRRGGVGATGIMFDGSADLAADTDPIVGGMLVDFKAGQGRAPRQGQHPRPAQQTPITQHRRLALLRKLITDDTGALRTRVAAILMLLYAQPPRPHLASDHRRHRRHRTRRPPAPRRPTDTGPRTGRRPAAGPGSYSRHRSSPRLSASTTTPPSGTTPPPAEPGPIRRINMRPANAKAHARRHNASGHP
jgi:hypothetical protein